MISPSFKIGRTWIGGNHPCFIIAEIGINHDGKFEQALKLIDAAAAAKCDAVKFQLFSARRMYTPEAGKYRTANGKEKDIIEIIKDTELPTHWIPKLKRYARSKGLEFFSSLFDEQAADILEKYGADAYKIASSEAAHIPLIRHVARKGKPVLYSTGMATMAEVMSSAGVILAEGSGKLVIMQCAAVYPAPLSVLNLNVIRTFKSAFPEAIIGFSDHTSDPVLAPVAAVAMGAKVIEKHITLDRGLPGPDHVFALNPQELARMVREVRKTEKRMSSGSLIRVNPKIGGSYEKTTEKAEAYYRRFLYRCVFATKNIKKGERFSKRNLSVLRPGKQKRGLDPKYYDLLTSGLRAIRKVTRGKSVQWQDIKN